MKITLKTTAIIRLAILPLIAFATLPFIGCGNNNYENQYKGGIYISRDLPDTNQSVDSTDTFGEDVDYSINPPAFSNNNDGTVTDLITGLMWQREDDNIRRSQYNAEEYCEDFSRAGYRDWRLPLRGELYSIVDLGHYNPAIDANIFPDTNSYAYMSATDLLGDEFPNEDDDIGNWYVDFDNGTSDSIELFRYNDPNDGYVRCVRGDIALPDYTDNGDDTVTDDVTGLIWQQETDDQEHTWEEAIAYCENLDLNDQTDWRLPNIKELESLIVFWKGREGIDVDYFPDATANTALWSSTTHMYWSDNQLQLDYAYFIKSSDAVVSSALKTAETNCRCVRGNN